MEIVSPQLQNSQFLPPLPFHQDSATRMSAVNQDTVQPDGSQQCTDPSSSGTTTSGKRFTANMRVADMQQLGMIVLEKCLALDNQLYEAQQMRTQCQAREAAYQALAIHCSSLQTENARLKAENKSLLVQMEELQHDGNVFNNEMASSLEGHSFNLEEQNMLKDQELNTLKGSYEELAQELENTRDEVAARMDDTENVKIKNISLSKLIDGLCASANRFREKRQLWRQACKKRLEDKVKAEQACEKLEAEVMKLKQVVKDREREIDNLQVDLSTKELELMDANDEIEVHRKSRKNIL